MHNSRVAVALMDSAMIFGAGASPAFCSGSICIPVLGFAIVYHCFT